MILFLFLGRDEDRSFDWIIDIFVISFVISRK